LATDWRLATKVLAGWDCGVALYLIIGYRLITRSTVSEIRHRACNQDEGAFALLLLCAAAALASLAAIVADVGHAEASRAWSNRAVGMGTIVLSWLFMHTIFALHYAHEYYGEGRDREVGGLKFPDRAPPDYMDFLYFSFVIAMTSQVSDVMI